MNEHKFYNLIISSLFIGLFVVGTLTFEDYGIGIDDKFHRKNGLYWMDYLLSFTNLNELQSLVKLKLIETNDLTLGTIKYYNKYGIIFDLPAVVLELIFNLNDPKEYYELRHYLNFIYFFIGCIFFYKLLGLRFGRLITFFGTCLYIFSPRIYGDSFYNMKDIIFLTFLVISYYYCYKCFLKFNVKNLLFLAIISAISIETRILGLSIPLSFLSFYFLGLLSKPKEIKNLSKIFFYLFSTFFFLVLIWPYLWSAPLANFLAIISSLENWVPFIYIFFNGEFINNSYLPYSYVPLWMLITTPSIHILLFFIGTVYALKRLYFRLITIEKNQFSSDLWRGVKEKNDLFILLNFITLLLLVILLNVRFINTWKYLYFANFYIVYLAVLGLDICYLWSKKFKKQILFIASFVIICFFLVFKMVKYHPYQGLYFNSLLSDNFKNKFEIDYTALSAKHFFDKIFELENNNDIINIASASWTPLVRTLDIYKDRNKKRVVLLGQEYKNAKYIYSNNISEVNKKYNDKYDIPKDFFKIYEYKTEGIIIYAIYKKKL